MHIKATENNSGWLFGELLGSCVGLVSQQRWRRVRKPFECHFTRPASIKRSKSFIHEAGEFIQTLNDNGRKSIINTTNDLKYCPFFMVASIFFGDLTTEQRKELYALGLQREELFKDTFMGGINRYAIAKYLPGSAMPRLRNFKRTWELFVRQACEEATRKGDGAIIPLWEAMKSREISMQEVWLTETLLLSLILLTMISFSKRSMNRYSQTWMLQLMQCRGICSELLSTLTFSKSCE